MMIDYANNNSLELHGFDGKIYLYAEITAMKTSGYVKAGELIGHTKVNRKNEAPKWYPLNMLHLEAYEGKPGLGRVIQDRKWPSETRSDIIDPTYLYSL
jgi:hypothetical protein